MCCILLGFDLSHLPTFWSCLTYLFILAPGATTRVHGLYSFFCLAVKGVVVVPIPKREKWVLTFGVLAVVWWSSLKGDTIFTDKSCEVLAKAGQLLSEAIGI